MIHHLRLRHLFLAALTAFVSLVAGPTFGAPIYSGWFRHSDSVARSWNFTEVAGDPLQVIVANRQQFSGPARRVMVLYFKPSPAYDIAISEILTVFNNKQLNAEFRIINFEIKDGLGAAALELAEAEDFDLIFSMGSEATSWLHQYYRNGRIPVVTVCSKDPVSLGHLADYTHGSGTNFAFTSLNMPIDVQLAYLIDFLPDLKNLGILVSSQNISAVRTQAKPMEEAARAKGINVNYMAVQSLESDADGTRAELATLVPSVVEAMRATDPALSKSLFWITGSTSVFREIATINAHADRVPVVSAVPEVVQAGDDSAVMSIGISFESNAHLAALYGYDVVMHNVEPGDLPAGVVTPPDIAINFRRAQQIGLEIPFSFFESANYVYDNQGVAVRVRGGDQ